MTQHTLLPSASRRKCLSRAGFVGLSLVAATALSLGACTRPDLETGTVLDRWAPTVNEQTEYLEVLVEPSQSSLSAQQRADIERFVSSYEAKGSGPLILSAPSSATNTEATAKLTPEVHQVLSGASQGALRLASGQYDGRGDAAAPLILAYKQYTTAVPNCPPAAVQNFVKTYSNKPTVGFGCAVSSNFALMVADPADLMAIRALDASDINRREIVLEKYRQGEPTGAQRTDDESGSLATAVQ